MSTTMSDNTLTTSAKTSTTSVASAKTTKISKNTKNKKRYQNSVPVFRVRPDGSERGILKHVGFVDENEKLGDEIVELVKPLHPDHDVWGINTLPIKNIDDFDIMGHIYRCNIVGSHVVSSRRYPVMYLDIYYEKSMVAGSLFQLFFSIDMNAEEKKAITENKRYVDLRFSGKWFRHIDCDEELVTNYDEMVSSMLEDDSAQLFYTSTDSDIISKRERFTDDEIAEWIEEYVKTEKKFYADLMMETPVTFRTLNKLRDWLIELSQSEKFYKFLRIAMKCRELHRRVEHGLDEDSVFVIPKKVTNLNDVKQKMIEDDELILEDD